jgi:hemoglobin-like flavoprotein
MRSDQIKLVKRTWRILMKIDPSLIGDLFYTKLFSDHASLRGLFPENMEQQNIKLVDMLSSIILNLDNFGLNIDDLKAMGMRHISYGVKPHHYNLVGSALIWTLEKGLGSDWNEETKNAWITCYTSIADAMQQVEVKS